jgi:hypothetical protein
MGNISAILSRVLETLFLAQPVRSAIGVLLGVCFHTVIVVFKPALAHLHWVDASDLKPWQLMAFGILVAQLPRLFHRAALDERVEQVLRMIEEAKRGGVGELEVTLMYRTLFERVIQNLDVVKSSDEHQKSRKDQQLQQSSQ